MMAYALWILIGLTVYCYFGYPVLIWVVSRLVDRPVQTSPATPDVTIVMAVHNEEDVIEGKIKNLLALDYPAEHLSIVIGSDGSDDATDDIVRRYSDQGVRLAAFSQRRGKMPVLNDLVGEATTDILVFNDARQSLDAQAIRALVANFSDPVVGCVSGELIFTQGESGTGKGVGLYWHYEKFLRKCESRVHSMLGATGAIYAIRRSLYTSLPPEVVLDDVYVPLKIVAQGYRAIFDEQAKAYDRVAENPREEYRRKARTLFGNYQIFSLMPEAFIIGRSPIAMQLFSHKFLRVVIPFFLIAVFLLNFLLLGALLYDSLFFGQIIFYGMAIVGGLARHQKYGILKICSNICYIPYVFCLLNFSAFVGFFRFAGGRQDGAWDKARTKN